jgi:hypothetical protein
MRVGFLTILKFHGFNTMKKMTEGSVLLLNGGSCNAYGYTATKQSITLICITKQSKGINGFVSFLPSSSFFVYFWASWNALATLCRPICILERCLDSNPENCRSKQVCYQLIHPSTYLATHLPT